MAANELTATVTTKAAKFIHFSKEEVLVSDITLTIQ
jgi:hypothetical protein